MAPSNDVQIAMEHGMMIAYRCYRPHLEDDQGWQIKQPGADKCPSGTRPLASAPVESRSQRRTLTCATGEGFWFATAGRAEFIYQSNHACRVRSWHFAGPTRPPLVNDHPRRPGGSHCAALSAHHRFHLDRGGLRAARGVRGRPLQSAAELPLRALPDRGAGHGERLLLSPGADLRRARAARLVYFATTYNPGFAIPMLVSTIIAAASVVISLLLSPETKGKVLVPDLVVA
jgi:hypothetical protein